MMAKGKAISGFSKLSSKEKRKWLQEVFGLEKEFSEDLQNHLHQDSKLQELYEEFSENTISNFFIPYGLAPNFLINGKWYVVPMAIEESSVVAAASHAAKFWSTHGGFHAEIVNTIKVGHVHFMWNGSRDVIRNLFNLALPELIDSLKPITESMEKRGGGIRDIQLIDRTDALEHYFQLHVNFMTADAMGANFINTVLEALAKAWQEKVIEATTSGKIEGSIEINMSILSNYTPECLVRVWVESDTEVLGIFDSNFTGKEFAEKFVRAVQIAQCDIYRAVTHNKGIFNGMDGVVIATGNDFRAVEACGHAYASRSGKYSSLSKAEIKGDKFRFELEVPMAVGTVGGLTGSHPLARVSMGILGQPGAIELMMIIAAAGLANNFSAVRSLVTSGIQKGHMKMHLTNILRQLGASEAEKQKAIAHFSNKTVSFAAVRQFISDLK